MRRAVRIILGIVVALLALLGAAVAFLWFAPMGSLPVVQANAPTSYEETLARIEAVQARDGEDINPVCRTFALTHDEPTENAIALLHGMSNCPEQWRPFATLLFEAGYNVYVPRMPYNGFADRLDTRASNIRVGDLVAYGAETVDILQGLGENTQIMGLSAGGTVATWVAMNRPEVDGVFIIAPSYMTQAVPEWASRVALNFMRVIPNQQYWWNSTLKEDVPGPPYAAPLVYSREAGEQFRFGHMLLAQAQSTPPVMPVTFIRNENDTAIHPGLVNAMIARWIDGDARVETFTFPIELGVDHDIIDLYQTSQRADVVYPQLFEMLTGTPYTGEIPTLPPAAP